MDIVIIYVILAHIFGVAFEQASRGSGPPWDASSFWDPYHWGMRLAHYTLPIYLLWAHQASLANWVLIGLASLGIRVPLTLYFKGMPRKLVWWRNNIKSGGGD